MGEVFNEFDETTTSSNVVIEGNTIENIKCWVDEIPAAVEGGAVMNDARGSVFQFINSVDNTLLSINGDGTYKGNVVADMQIMVAKAIREGLIEDLPEHQTAVNTIEQTLIDWAMNDTVTYSPKYRCNGDAMHHVSKGIIAIRVEDTAGFTIKNNNIKEVESVSVAPFADCFDFHTGASFENEMEQQGGNIRGISVAAVRGHDSKKNSHIEDNVVKNMKSPNANVIIGIDVQGDSAGVAIEKNAVDLQSGVGKNPNDEYIACRIRQFVHSSVTAEDNNELKQEEQILNTRRLQLSERLEGHTSGEIEWKTGGCPFARRK